MTGAATVGGAVIIIIIIIITIIIIIIIIIGNDAGLVNDLRFALVRVLDLREGMGFTLPFGRVGKLEIVWSPVDETPKFTTGGIFKDAPHPNAAKLYLTWFLARQQQSRLGLFSSRVDMPSP